MKLHGLKKRKQWNGKKAMIIGAGVVKKGMFRWPIQLQSKCKSWALLKQTNLSVAMAK